MLNTELEYIYNISKEIPKSIHLLNKYTFLAFYGIIECKYLDVNDILDSTKHIPDDISSFITKFSQVLLFPNTFNNTIIDTSFRALQDKAVLSYGEKGVPYGVGYLREDFKYGDPLFLVEGIGDYGAIKLIDKTIDVLAYKSNNVSAKQVTFLSYLTNNLIILPDNDEHGSDHIRRLKNTFDKLSINLEVIQQHNSIKDTGDIVDKLIKYSLLKDNLLKEEIEVLKEYYLSLINFYRGV